MTAKREFRQRQRIVKRAVDKVREHWIRRVAMEGEVAVKDGKTRWECIRKCNKYMLGADQQDQVQ